SCPGTARATSPPPPFLRMAASCKAASASRARAAPLSFRSRKRRYLPMTQSQHSFTLGDEGLWWMGGVINRELIIAGTGAGGVVAGNVIAQNVPMPEVIVEAHRAVSTRIGTTSQGVPINEVSMGYTVTAEGLDISTDIGKRAFEARISHAAMAACQEITRRFHS